MKNRKPLESHEKWSFHFNKKKKKNYRLHRLNIRVDDEKTVSSKNDSESQLLPIARSAPYDRSYRPFSVHYKTV